VGPSKRPVARHSDDHPAHPWTPNRQAAVGPLAALNIMGLSNPQGAILAAIIFNALIIVGLIPLALKGVAYRPIGAGPLLRRNLLIYGVGGVLVPFAGIWAIYQVVAALHLV